jgi:hypothetical protein
MAAVGGHPPAGTIIKKALNQIAQNGPGE